MLGVYNYTVILTYAGMIIGFTGILLATQGDLRAALICLVIAGVCDMFDGTLASTMKRTAKEKRFGVQIDSFSDLVCFGVLPALIVWYAAGRSAFVIASCDVYMLCTLIRLAWFNVDEEERQRLESGPRRFYHGLPVTMAALVFPALMAAGHIFSWPIRWIAPILLLVMSCLFLTPFKIRKPRFNRQAADDAICGESDGEASEGRIVKESGGVIFLYGSAVGHALLRLMLSAPVQRAVVRFLSSGASRPWIGTYARNHNIKLEQGSAYRSFRDFFCRKIEKDDVDLTPDHLISPCDGWLCAFPISSDKSFIIKGIRYQLDELLLDTDSAQLFSEGDCLIIRLTPSDYHRYCYIDSGLQKENKYIEGTLHSVQPAALERYPVYTLNRRCRTIFQTDNFGTVAQIEVGAMAVGGIVNHHENCRVQKGDEMGYFDFAGSTIVLLFQKDRIRLLPQLQSSLNDEEEVRVEYGKQIGTALPREDI
ncbi:MAG: phosphatidylserine decarboxylase [Clostridia bacterium]|nr:phosphatidylserine decarboxylase [Clostridia bacterium]